MEPLKNWSDYVQSLAGQPLWSKAIGCNTQAFASTLMEEGYSMGDVREILLYFVRQMAAVGMNPPEGGLFDLVQMRLIDPVCRATKPMPEERADALERAALKVVEETPDYFQEV